MPKRTRTAGRRLDQIRVRRARGRANRRRLPQRRDVVENPEAAAVRAGDEIGAQARAVVLHLQIAHRDGRHVEPQRLPVIAVVERHPHLRVGGGVEQSLLPRILADRIRDRARRDAGVDLRPRLAAVVRAPEVRIEVVDAHRVRRGVRGERVEVAGLDVEDARPRLDLRRRDVRPLRAAVHRHLDVAVVGAGPEDVDVLRRRRERGDRCRAAPA